MKQVAYLQTNKQHHALYNDVVLKSLENVGVKYSLRSFHTGKRLLVQDADKEVAEKTIKRISYTNPKYPK